MAEHKLKTWPMFFEAMLRGEKTFEVRSIADRIFQKGDILVLQRTRENELGSDVEWDIYPTTARDEIRKRVTYVMPGGSMGIAAGYVVMGLGPVAGAPSALDLAKALKNILPLAEAGARALARSPSSHQEFLREDQDALAEARAALKGEAS